MKATKQANTQAYTDANATEASHPTELSRSLPISTCLKRYKSYQYDWTLRCPVTYVTAPHCVRCSGTTTNIENATLLLFLEKMNDFFFQTRWKYQPCIMR